MQAGPQHSLCEGGGAKLRQNREETKRILSLSGSADPTRREIETLGFNDLGSIRGTRPEATGCLPDPGQIFTFFHRPLRKMMKATIVINDSAVTMA
jgi:hypothetical protein